MSWEQDCCSLMNLGNIFLGSEHEYEIVLANKGDIEAIYTLSSPSKEFKFDPREGIVTPGEFDGMKTLG